MSKEIYCRAIIDPKEIHAKAELGQTVRFYEAGPSATRHTIYFEFEDETSTTFYVYYDSAFVGNAITATTPTTYDSKTVTSAQLDGTTWYSYTPTPSGDWQTYYDGTIDVFGGTATLASLAELYFAQGESWRVTYDGTAYICESTYYEAGNTYILGNIDVLTNQYDGTGEPFVIYNVGWGALYIDTTDTADNPHTFKLERHVSA